MNSLTTKHRAPSERNVECRYDIGIVGAGIAGASLAARLAGSARVVLVEEEARPGYHATGRSAAFWHESYGGEGVQPLTTASGAFLRDNGFLKARSALTIGRAGQEKQVEEFALRFAAAGVRAELVGVEEMSRRIPGLRPGWTRAVLEVECSDIDVAALHQHYLAVARASGTDIRCSAGLRTAEPAPAGWRLVLADGAVVDCAILVNAAGAWADTVATIAGARPLGIRPLRRTVVQLRVSPPVAGDLPLVLDIGETFYFKPESGRLWLSPQDETPSPPCDAAPDEIDVATAIARLGDVVDWRVERVEHKWAGLRSFAPDRLPVYGFDPDTPGFFWFAGQGGFGIQTAPAAADLAAGLLLGEPAGQVDPARYAPGRFA